MSNPPCNIGRVKKKIEKWIQTELSFAEQLELALELERRAHIIRENVKQLACPESLRARLLFPDPQRREFWN